MNDPLDHKIVLLVNDLECRDRAGKMNALRAFLEYDRGLTDAAFYLDEVDLNLVLSHATRVFNARPSNEVLANLSPELKRAAAFVDATCQVLGTKGFLRQKMGVKAKSRTYELCSHSGCFGNSEEGFTCTSCGKTLRALGWTAVD